MSKFLANDRKVIAWVLGIDLPRVHAILDEAVYKKPIPFARLTEPLERISRPGEIAGWGVSTPAPSSYAPSMPAIIEMLIPTDEMDGGELTAHYQWRSSPGKHVGWAVLEAKINGPWQSFTTETAELAKHGLRWMKGPSFEDNEVAFMAWADMIAMAKQAQEGEYTLTEAEEATMDVLIDAFYQVGSHTLDALFVEHRLGNARARLMKRCMDAE